MKERVVERRVQRHAFTDKTDEKKKSTDRLEGKGINEHLMQQPNNPLRRGNAQTSAYGSYSGCRQYREDVARALTLLAVGVDRTTGQGARADTAARVVADRKSVV